MNIKSMLMLVRTRLQGLLDSAFTMAAGPNENADVPLFCKVPHPYNSLEDSRNEVDIHPVW